MGDQDNYVVTTSPAEVTPMSMLNMAVSQGADLDKLERLMSLQERWEKNEAKKAYVEAKSRFHAECPIVRKDKRNNQYNSGYTSKANLIKTVAPVLSKHGLSHSFDVRQDGELIFITCRLTHNKGYSEECTMHGPPDKSGAKNPIQQIKSTKTYLEIATFEAVTGVASEEGALDDDGEGSGQQDNTKFDEWMIKVDELSGQPSDDIAAWWKKYGSEIKKELTKAQAAQVYNAMLVHKKAAK